MLSWTKVTLFAFSAFFPEKALTTILVFYSVTTGKSFPFFLGNLTSSAGKTKLGNPFPSVTTVDNHPGYWLSVIKINNLINDEKMWHTDKVAVPQRSTGVSPQAAQALFMNHSRHTTWRRITRACTGSSTRHPRRQLKVKLFNKNDLPSSMRVLFASGVVVSPI